MPRGSVESPTNESKWPAHSSFRVLGHILDNNGSCADCWHNTRCSMWRAFFANYRKCLRPKCAFQMLQCAVLPCLDFRNTRWPAHSALSIKMDRVQRQMVASILRPQVRSDDSPESFVRRRSRVSVAEARRMSAVLGACGTASECCLGGITCCVLPALAAGHLSYSSSKASIG